jgi:hypothetical protein
MVLIFSASANTSGQIHREIERAVSKGVPIVPLRIEQVLPTKSMEYFLGAIHWLDAKTPPLESDLQKLVDTVASLVEVAKAKAGSDGATAPPARGKPSYAAHRQSPDAKASEEALLKIQVPRRWLSATLGAAACVVLVPVPAQALAPQPPPTMSASAPAPPPMQKAAVALVPEMVPFIRNSDRELIRSEYLTASDHKALAISYSRISFTTAQADDETAKAVALDSCKRAQEAIKSAYPCWLYAVGNTVVFSGMPPAPWLIRNPAIDTTYAPDNVPLINAFQRTHWAKIYADVTQAKAISLSPHGSGFDYFGGTEEENIRRALEACGYANGVPCKIIAVDNTFVVPIPQAMKAVGFFNVNTDPTIAPEMRSALVERLANAPNAWTAVALGVKGCRAARSMPVTRRTQSKRL